MPSHLKLPYIDPDTPLGHADAAVADRLVPLADHPAIGAVEWAGDLADQEPLYAAAASVIVTGIAMRDGKLVRGGTHILASHLLATALRGVIKHMVDRTRPEAAARRGEYELSEGERYESDFNSFPSGHAAGAVAVGSAVAREWPDAAPLAHGLAAAATVAPVASSRHFVSDVLAGAAIGLVADAAISRLLRWAEER